VIISVEEARLWPYLEASNKQEISLVVNIVKKLLSYSTMRASLQTHLLACHSREAPLTKEFLPIKANSYSRAGWTLPNTKQHAALLYFGVMEKHTYHLLSGETSGT